MITSRRLDASVHPSFDNHEQVVQFEDAATGLKAIIAVHNTNLGASLGGCRIYPYASENDALNDVLRLSRGMTYKSALAGLPLGGGKAVIIANPRLDKTAEMMRSFGEAVEKMAGAYITAEDVGSTEEDMIEISKSTSYVAGLPEEGNGESVAGNPSPVTAYGVYCGIKACAKAKFGSADLKGRRIAIQGMGAVGYALAQYLSKEGASLVIADIHEDVIEKAKAEFGSGVSVLEPVHIHAADVDIFAPCALGAILNDRTIPDIKAAIIGGAANNQLAERRHDIMLKEKGIIYAPDYAINSGGITSVGYEYFHRTGRNPYSYALTRTSMMEHVARIGDTLEKIMSIAAERNIPTGEASDQLAEEIFKAAAPSSRGTKATTAA